MNFKDADKILRQALFLRNADRFERRFAFSVSELRDLFVEAFRVACPGVDVEVDTDDVGSLTAAAHGNSAEISVRNLFDRLQSMDDQDARQAVIDHLIGLVPAVRDSMKPNAATKAEGELVLMIATDRMVSDLNKALGTSSLFSWSLGKNVNAIAIRDGAKTRRYVLNEDLPGMGMTGEQAKVEILKNLAKKLRVKKPKAEANRIGTVTVHANDSMVSSMLALEPFVASLREKVGGDMLILLSHEDMMVLMPTNSADSMHSTMSLAASGRIGSMYDGAHFLLDETGLSAVTMDEINDLIAAATPAPGRSPIN